MSDLIRFFGVLIAVIGAGTAAYTVISFVGVFVRRLERAGRPGENALQAEVEDLRARVEAGEGLPGRVAELEERLDFAERVLARNRDAARLPAGGA